MICETLLDDRILDELTVGEFMEKLLRNFRNGTNIIEFRKRFRKFLFEKKTNKQQMRDCSRYFVKLFLKNSDFQEIKQQLQ